MSRRGVATGFEKFQQPSLQTVSAVPKLDVVAVRKLIGILIPVTQGLVQFLIERNISRVLTNIRHGEDHGIDPE